MKYGLPFAALGILCTVYSAKVPLVPALLLLNTAAAFAGVALGYLGAGPPVFMKRKSGAFSPLGYALYWPYLLLNGALLGLMRLSQERVLDTIVPGLYLGRKPTWMDRTLLRNRPISAVLDLTGEFPELGELRRPGHYRCIPLLDTGAPTGDQLSLGVAFIGEQMRNGTVLVHCALGHGRSALFVAAYLLAAGHAPAPEAALALIRARRPGIELHPNQQRALERFAASLAPREESNHE